MAERKQDDYTTDPAGSDPARGGEAFKREGPAPGTGDTGRDVDEMNEKAAASVLRNVTPDDATD